MVQIDKEETSKSGHCVSVFYHQNMNLQLQLLMNLLMHLRMVSKYKIWHCPCSSAWPKKETLSFFTRHITNCT